MEASEDVVTVKGPLVDLSDPAQQNAQALASALLELNAQISVVKGARIDYQDDKKSLNALRETFEKANADLIARCQARSIVVLSEEDRLRELTLAAYALDPTCKKPAPGVGVRVSNIIEYDPKEALEYAKKELPGMIIVSLDNPAFYDFMARRIKENRPLPIEVRTYDNLTATISKDL
jgi:hypothetical protein